MGCNLSKKSKQTDLAIYMRKGRSSDQVTYRFINSYGIRSTLMQFFEPIEFAQLQILSSHFYRNLIGTVQTRLAKQRSFIRQPVFTFSWGPKYAKSLFEFKRQGASEKEIDSYFKSFKEHISVQISPDTLYLFGMVIGNLTEMSGVTTGQYSFTSRKKSPSTGKRLFPSMVNYKVKVLVLIGGMTNYGVGDSVEVFWIAENKWTTAFPINQQRYYHSSCMAGHLLYIFGGCEDERNNCTNSMECLDMNEFLSGKNPQWQTIDFISQSAAISPRSRPIMSHISGDTILIAGGGLDFNHYLVDWYKVDLAKQTVDKVLENEDFEFQCRDNQCKMINEDNLVALVHDSNWVVQMIKFTISNNSLKIIDSFGTWPE